MPFGKVLLKPGIETRLSQAANAGGWSACQLIRFMGGLPQKLGGWQSLVPTTPLIGTSRCIHGWADLMGLPYLASGSEQRLQVLEAGNIYDITPLRLTDNIPPSFSTTISSPTVTVTDAGSGVELGDWINIAVQVAVGGLTLLGYYLVRSVVDANNFTITAAANAAGTVANGGAVPVFTTTNTSANVSVAFAAHGLLTGSIFNVQVSTSGNNVTLFGAYNVASVTDANNFVIVASTVANSSGPIPENGGNVEIQYLIASGLASNTGVSGYGIGLYGAGFYGTGSGAVISPLRTWFLDNWGQSLVGNYNNSPIYVWTPSVITPAVPVGGSAPTLNTGSFVIAPVQILVALGSSTSGVQDPNLVRWSDVADYTDFTPTVTNQAGSYRIPSGSRIIGGLFSSQQGLIWTDIDLWSMTYQNLPFVFGFNKIGNECGLIAPHAAGVIAGQVFWMSYQGFFTLGANGAQPVPCMVRDQIFNNLYTAQENKIICFVNSLFNEIGWMFPSASGTGEIDSYVKMNIVENTWDYGSLTRTAWTDVSPVGYPVGVDQNGFLQQHETSPDNDGMPLVWFIESGFFDISVGEEFSFVDQMIPDVSQSTTQGAMIQYTVKTTVWADDTPVVAGPYTVANPTSFISTRARGRQMAVRIAGADLGTFVRPAAIRWRYSVDGRR